MKKIIMWIILLQHFLISPFCIDQYWRYCTLSNCVIVGMLVHSIWTWHATRLELIYCDQQIKIYNSLQQQLFEERHVTKERDQLLAYQDYKKLKNNYLENVRQLNLRQIKATIKKEQSAQSIFAGIAGNLIKLY